MRLYKHICTNHDYFPGNLYKSKQLRRRYSVLLYTYQLTSANIVEVNIITNTLYLLQWSVCCYCCRSSQNKQLFRIFPPPLVWFRVNFPFSIHFRYYYHLMLFPGRAAIPNAIQYNTFKFAHISQHGEYSRYVHSTNVRVVQEPPNQTESNQISCQCYTYLLKM